MSNQSKNKDDFNFDTPATRKKYSTFNKNQFVGKIILSLATIYFAIALGFAAISPYTYKRADENLIHSLSTTLSQPLSEVGYGGKVSRFYDWKSLPSNTLDQDLPLTKIRPSNKDIKFNSSNFEKAMFQLQGKNEVVLILPEDTKTDWVINVCYKGDIDSVCVQSNLVVNGQIRLLIRDEGNIWGETLDGKKLKLTIIKYIKTDERRDLLLI